MTPELSFLLDLVLNHKLQKATKDHIASRIKEIEELRVASPQAAKPILQMGGQAPSMAAKVAAMEAERGLGVAVSVIDTPPPVTAAAAQALIDRQNAINNAVNAGPFGAKPPEGRTSPRKF